MLDLPDTTLQQGETLYLMLDGIQLPHLERTLYQLLGSPEHQPIYLHAPWGELRAAGPMLVKAVPLLLEWYQQQSPKVGWLLASPLALIPLSDRLRQLIQVKSPYGSKVLLKMGRPEAMQRLLQDDTPWLWEGITRVWLPVRQGVRPDLTKAPAPYEWWYKQVRQPLDERQGELMQLSDAQWARLGEVTWLATLDKIAAHMETFFPERLAEQADPAGWIVQWAQWGYDKGFITNSDLLLLFSVLGYLGTGWWEGNEHPEIRTLLIQASAQTPSQRIETAAYLAEAIHQQRAHAGVTE